MRESLVHDIILNSDVAKKNIESILNISEDSVFIHEDTYINGITADFTVVSNNNIRAIIECKGGDINVTDYVRGIGQVFQYEYFNEKNISKKGYSYDESFNTILLYPSSIIKNNQFNIGKFKYPNSIKLFELNENNHIIREVDKKELKQLEEAENSNLVTISQYYIRDNRIYELYILLKYVSYLKNIGEENCDRRESEINFLRKIETHNNRNWRNAFISLSSLGLINSKNLPTPSGDILAGKTYEEFALNIYNSYLKPYFKEIFDVLENDLFTNINNQNLVDKFREKYNGRDILFLSQSNGRYISSWLNIFRDDYGCIYFEPRNSNRKINYNPINFNDEALKSKIKNYSIAYQYIDKYYEILRR